MVDSIKKDISSNPINIVKDETAAEKMETPTAEKIEILTKELEELKAKQKTFEKEVKSVRQSVDNWKKDVNNRSEQIMNDVDRKINNKVGALVKAKKELNDDVQAITQSIKQEVFQLDKVGRKSVIDEITKAKNDIIDHVSEELGVDDLEGPNLKEAFVNNIKNELGLEGIKTELGNFGKSISTLKKDVTGIGFNFTYLKRNVEELKAENLVDRVNILGTEVENLKVKQGSEVSVVDEKVKQEILAEVTDKFLDAAVEDLCSELKSNWQKVHRDIETLE